MVMINPETMDLLSLLKQDTAEAKAMIRGVLDRRYNDFINRKPDKKEVRK